MKQFTISNQLTAIGKRLAMVLTVLFTLGVGSMLGATTTYTFTTKSWGDSSNGWTSGKDGNELTKNQGVQVTTGVSGANATTKNSFSNISTIAIKYCTNASKGAGTISVQVGSNTAKSFTVSKPSSGGTTLKTTTFTFNPNESGKIKISVTCTANSIYINSVTITTVDAVSCTSAPIVSAASSSNITTNSATVTCSEGITSLGSAGCSITHYGFVYGTSSNPTISNTKVQVGTSYAKTGTPFDKSITGLSANTTYYVRPYATNGYGTAYGTQTTFKTLELPKYTVSFNTGTGNPTQADIAETTGGAGITLPAGPTPTCTDWYFAGWAEESVSTETTTKPTLFAANSNYKPTSNITLYAVYQRTETTQGGGDSEEIVDFSKQNYTNGDVISTYTGTDFSVAFNKGTNSNDPKYYTSGTAIRIYGGGYFTISSESIITKIVITFGSSDGSNAITTDVDTYSDSTWTGSANSVKFTIGGSSGNRRIKSLVVTTTGGGTITTTYYHSNPECGTPTPTPTLNVDPATLTFENTTTNTSREKTFTLTGSNLTENASLQLSGIDPEMFSLSSNSVTQSEGSINQTITVTYTPTAAGDHTATLTISSTGAESKTVTLSGTGVAPYTVTFDAGEHGTCATTFLTESTAGAGVTLPNVTPNSDYRFLGWATTYNATIADAGTAGDKYKPASDITLYAVYKQLHTITWNAAGETSTTTVVDGEHIELPISDPSSCSDTYTTFVGWYTEASGMETSPSVTPQGEQVTASTIPTGNTTYYAVWADAGDAEEVVDVINNAFTINKTQTNYATWSNTGTSGTSYIGNSAGGNGTVQLRASDASGIVTTASGGKAKKVTVVWNSSTADGRTLNVYGKNSAYSAASDLYDNSNQGTNLGSIVEGTSTELTINGDYEYIGLRSNSGAMYLDKIQITWSAGSDPTGYISSCCQSPAVVTVTPADASLELNIDGTASTTVHISQSNGGNGEYYEPTVSPADGASLNWAALGVEYKQTAYDINFTATKAGTYTVTGNFTETSYGCSKTGSATINVVANPILQVSEPTITSQCGTEGTPVAVTIDSRYLTGSSLTANVATTTSNGTFKICATENGTFGTSNLTNLTAGKDNKASITIYVRYDAIEDENTEATGTLTITDGTTSQEVELSTTPICGTSIRMTPTDANSVRVTTANGQWTRTQTVIHLRGAYLLQNLTGEQGAKVELTSSNPNFKFVKPDLQSSGTVKYESEKITDNTWEANVCLVYTPTTYNANETTTITAKVITFGGTTEHATSTLEAYGRSFPETFVLALYTGSEWVAVPADMIAPYGTGCNTGVGNHDPYPITVDDNANPTVAILAPTRAIYRGAARNTPMTNPWTIQFESNTQAGYYLFGSNNANTTIANTNQATGEGVKWALSTADNITYQLLQTTATGGQRLGYNATAKYMGQYKNAASNYKYDFRILPVEETCTYYIEPVMTLVDYTDDEAKVHIQYDGTNLYQISMDNKSTWKNVTGEIDCLDLTFTLPNTTYRGKDVWLKPQGDLCEDVVSSVACHIPAPVINNPGDQTFTGTVNQPFTGIFAITGSDLYQDISAITITDNSNPAIGATINNGTITVTMGASAVGTYTTNLTFDAVGAEEVTVKVTIEIRALATQSFDGGSYAFTDATPKILCENLTSTYEPIIYLSHSLYKNGTAISTTSELNETEFTLIDINTGSELSFSREGSDGGIASVTFNASTIAAMVPGHTYRLSWENTNQVMTNVGGLPYMDCYMDFIYSENCDAPTALAACPITNSSFTANWIGDATKLNVYTKAETEALNQDITDASLNLWQSYNNDYTAKWLYGLKGDMDYNLHTTYGFQVSSTGSSWAYLYTPQIGKMLAGVTANTEIEVTIEAYCYNTANKIKCFVIDGEPTNKTFPQSGDMVTINGASANSWTSELLPIPAYTEVSFRVSGLSSTSRIAISALNASKTTYIKTVKISSVASQSIGIYSVTGDTYNVTGLSANTTYYYTVTDGSSNTSNEIAVTTYNGEPELKFYSDEACTTEITETTVLGGEETTVYVKGTHVPACAINASVSTGYGMDDSGINYITGTGVVSGSVILTLADANTTEGTLTITDAEDNDYVLNIVSSDCPAGFGTMASLATNITSNTAQANWENTLDFGDDKSGTLQLYKNGIVNRELIVNGDFETGSLADGWSNGINKGEVGAAHSFEQYTIKNSSSEAYKGNYSLYVTADNNSTLTNFHGQSVMYADYVTLTPGTYTMSAWVKMPTANGYSDKMQYFSLGIITGENGSEHVYTVSTPVTVYSNNTYVQLTHEFKVTSTITKACPAIGASSGTFRYFYLDDVSLKCTSIGQGEEPYLSIDIDDLSAAGNLALTDLSGNTEYTYIIQNADGCSSNPITFQTIDAGAPQLSVTTPVSIAAPLGGSAKGVATVTATDAYNTINVTLADNEQRIRLNATTIPAAGGVVQFTFTPLNTDYPGTTGTSIVTLTTQGMANPVELTINWAVTSGIDVNTPMVEVTEISNEQITIEHNVGVGDDDLEVRIIMNRPITDDEKEENVGDEIFFSKYYEAYMHKKLWAIFNPTAQKRSLEGMQVWRSKSNYEDWNTAPENIIDLSEMGNYEKGWIYPNEEIIVYTADQVGECERSKTDMSNWVAMSSSNLPVSFSGDDALLLVRKASVVEQAKNNIPPTTSISTDTNGDPISISWRIYTDSVSQEWYMLDLIGARKDNNTPDGSATHSWSWEDCSTTPAKTEAGDAKGWVGYGYDLADNKIKYNSCEGEGYILSTNRCLLIRRMNVKSGANAVATNIGDMVTLNSEWKGSHVPKDGNQEQTSCENFSYVGGYDYDGYYNAWVPLEEEEFVYASQNEDGTYTFDMDVPHYYCDTMRIEVVEKVTVNGVESDNIHAYNLYKVPIVVDVDANTDDKKFFQYPERPSDDLNTSIPDEKELTTTICETCDVVIRDEAQLTHVEGGQGQFRNIMVYPGAKLNNTDGQAFRLQGLHIQALNDTVGYAIINNDQSSIVVDTIIHTKRINDQYWYIFSLPYDCNVAAIRQLNGKSMGNYGKDWGIQYYDGKARQKAGTSAAPGAVSEFWDKVAPNATLKANEAYIIGLFTTQWTNQHKTIYFPPTESTQYTESGNEAKETNVYNWNVNLAAEKRHHGWNFVGSPYISIFDPNGLTDAGVNNGNVVIKGEIQADGSYTNDTEVFVSIPDGSNARTYTQQRAASTKLEPFKGYFIQVVDPTSGEDETKTLQYSKTGRTLSNNAPARKAQAAREKVVVELELVAFDNQVDYAGVLVDDSYKPEYEISGDLVKMYAAASKPQLYLRDMTNEQMAYIALPDANAENIPLEFYAPKTGNYTLAMNQLKSRIHGAKTIELLYNGEVVANLMFDTYTIAAQKGVNKGYSIRIQRVAQVITSIDNVSMEGITIATTEGYITIEGLPTGAQVMLYDMVGKLIKADYEMNGIVNFDAPTQGVYEISIQTAQGNNCVKTIIR